MKKFFSILLEAIGEIFITILFFFIGWGILSLLGIDIFSGDSTELATLIGSVIFIGIFIIAAILVNKFNKNR